MHPDQLQHNPPLHSEKPNPQTLDCDEIERYSRQLLLPQFGVQSQLTLRRSRVLIIGLGGLGCPAALYLSGAGVGVLGLVDRPNDVVEKSNLHRQVAHAEKRVGMNKVESARVAITALNSHVRVETHQEIVPRNAVKLVKDYDVVLDCTDNVMSRYLISDACAVARVPLVSGSAIGLEGQLTVYCSSDETPCYRCIFPQPPPPSCVGSCDSAGVLGPVPGIIGTLQALEALKLLAKAKKTSVLEQRLLLFDATETSFRRVKLRPRVKTCVVCGDNPTVKVASFDYESFAIGSCSLEDTSEKGSLPRGLGNSLDPKYRLTVHQFNEMRSSPLKYRLIDVRPTPEFDICHLREAESLPLNTLQASIDSMYFESEDVPTVFVCRRGNASQTAVELCRTRGHENVFDITGGLQSWHYEIDKNFPLY